MNDDHEATQKSLFVYGGQAGDARQQAASVIESALQNQGQDPIEEMFTELTRDSSDPWVESTLHQPETHPALRGSAAFLQGDVTAEELRKLKRFSKKLTPGATTAFIYFVSQAASVLHHQQLHTSSPRAWLASIWKDLASITEGEWPPFFVAAQEALAQLPEESS